MDFPLNKEAAPGEPAAHNPTPSAHSAVVDSACSNPAGGDPAAAAFGGVTSASTSAAAAACASGITALNCFRAAPAAAAPLAPRAPALFRKCCPLQHKWTWWFMRNQNDGPMADVIEKVTEFQCLKEYYDRSEILKLPSQLKNNCECAIFKRDIKPVWEDPNNKQGGCWCVAFEKGSTYSIDELWKGLVVAMIREGFGYFEYEVCGAVVKVRGNNYKLTLWTFDAKNEEAVLAIGKILKSLLRLEDKKIKYQPNQSLDEYQKVKRVNKKKFLTKPIYTL